MANQRGETTSIGHFYNRCIDAVNNLFDTMSFWTHSKDVEFVDGKTAETKVGAINGITSDMSGEADDIAASIKCVNQLNNSLNSFRVGVNKIVSAVNSKAKTSLTESSTNEEIVEAINNIETNITGVTTTLLDTGYGAGQSVTVQNALSYKVFYGSFYYDTTGEYTIGVSGGKILVQKGYNYGANRYCSAVILPTSDTTKISAYGNFYVVGIK